MRTRASALSFVRQAEYASYAFRRWERESGGSRVLYLYVQVRQRIFVIAVYAKSEQGDITRKGYHFLARLAENLKKEK